MNLTNRDFDEESHVGKIVIKLEIEHKLFRAAK